MSIIIFCLSYYTVKRISHLLQKIFSGKRGRESLDVNQLRALFRERYHHFKLLLNANNKALQTMSEIEEAFKGSKPFGMSFVRSRCTRVATSTWQIIDHLNKLSPGQYEDLYDIFKEIQLKINYYILPGKKPKDGALVIPLEKVDREQVELAGSKMANLGEVGKRLGLNIPDGFVITAQAYMRFMSYNDLQSEINRRIQSSDIADPEQLYALSASLQQFIIRSPVPEDISNAVNSQYKIMKEKFGADFRMALRSSALGEDLLDTSFAGQYRSELNVSFENILEAYKGIVAGKYSHAAMTYRFNRGIRDEDLAMCVGCVRMIDAVAGGVVYSRNPVNLMDDSVVINSVWGLPKTVVDGSSASDLFIVSRKDGMRVLERQVPHKGQKFVCIEDEGVCRMDMVNDMADMASLTDEQISNLAGLADRIEEYYGLPQDVEWALDEKGSFFILQCRPLKRLKTDNREITHEFNKPDNSIILKGGITASPGTASGPVFKVTRDMDLLRFPEGSVLLVSQALPRWASLLGRAVAVISEQGSIAGHLANVAREFRVPALFGIKNAVKTLQDGLVITVDADGTMIYEGRIENALQNRSRPRNLMKGSQVYDSLQGASKLIVPLRLLDPDSPSFRPQNCNSFHDITRFCHEKSVAEMFSFGKDYHFSERSSKQLFVHIPMKWWVLNLDDGFREEVSGKYVKLENINSIPMIALWEGISAIPWEGPPPIDGKGFMSVMFQATTNTSLVPGIGSSYGNKNYFMISKNYCSLNSRLGFHFSLIEALVSERRTENYASFQFKGGATDHERKNRRVMLIGEVLEECGFGVDISGDSLIARMEDQEEDFMKKCLKVLGYLTIHTRQIDMIMANESSVEYYRGKIKKDIKMISEGSFF